MKKKSLLLSCSALFLFACGNEEATGIEISEQETPRVIEGGPTTLSQAVENYPVWFRVNDYPERSTEIQSIHFYNDGQISVYSLSHGAIMPSEFGDSVTLEEIVEYSDDELIELIETSYQDFVENGLAEMFEEQFQEKRESINEELESLAQENNSNSRSSENAEWRKNYLHYNKGKIDLFSDSLNEQLESDEYIELIDNSHTYTIDTILDGTGNRVESQRIIYNIPSLISLNDDKNFSLDLDEINSYLFLQNETVEVDDPDNYDPLNAAEVKIKEYTSRLTQPVTTGTPIRFSAGQNFEIFDALFAGYMVDQEFRYYITRIDDDSVEFLLDDTDVSHPNVTIEGNPSE